MFLQAAHHASDLPGGYGVALLQTLLALAAVCILAWTVLRWSSGRGLTGLGGGRIEILERAHLEPRRTLHLVRIGARTFLIGSGESGPPAILAEIPSGELPDAKPGARFADVLRRTRPAATVEPTKPGVPDSMGEA